MLRVVFPVSTHFRVSCWVYTLCFLCGPAALLCMSQLQQCPPGCQCALHPKKKASRRKGKGVQGTGAYNVPTTAVQLGNSLKRAAAPAIGAALGYASGGIPGAVAGISAGSAFNKAVGMGAYIVPRRNSLWSTDAQVPVMHSNATSIRVQHREFISNISSSVAFVNTTYNVNAGLAATFPWLSVLASNFEQYRFHGMLFVFVSTSADALNSTNTALGTIIMAADYNAATSSYGSKVQMEQAMWAVSDKPSNSQVAPIECDPGLNRSDVYFVRQSAVPAGSPTPASILDYDLCTFQIASVGSQAAAVVGELWVTYDVELMKPQTTYGAPNTAFSSHYTIAGVTGALPLGTSNVVVYDNIGVTLSTGGTSTITFPASVSGRFLVSYFQVGTATAYVAPVITFTNCTGLALSNAGTESTEWTTLAGGGTGAKIVMYITVSVPVSTTVSTINFGGAGTATGGAPVGDVLIAQLNSAVV